MISLFFFLTTTDRFCINKTVAEPPKGYSLKPRREKILNLPDIFPRVTNSPITEFDRVNSLHQPEFRFNAEDT